MMLKVQPIGSSISHAHREQGRSWGRKVAVEVRSLHKSYDQHLAVKDVSFSFRSGEVLGLLGPNSAGKSTVMMIITGLLAADSGEVILNREKYDGRRLEQRRLFGVVFSRTLAVSESYRDE